MLDCRDFVAFKRQWQVVPIFYEPSEGLSYRAFLVSLRSCAGNKADILLA